MPAAVRLRHELHARPELSGREHGTADRVVAAITAGFDGDRSDNGEAAIAVSAVADTGRLVRIGPAGGPAVAVRAELDALPLDERTGARWSSQVPGAMHACGHDVHLAAAAALARAAAAVHRAVGLPAALLLVLQPREELSPSGARDVVDSGLLEQQRVRSMIGVHVQPQVPPGQVAVDPGVVNAGMDEFTITVTGRGGHSAYPHLTRDPVPALCQSVLAARDAVERGRPDAAGRGHRGHAAGRHRAERDRRGGPGAGHRADHAPGRPGAAARAAADRGHRNRGRLRLHRRADRRARRGPAAQRPGPGRRGAGPARPAGRPPRSPSSGPAARTTSRPTARCCPP